MQRLQHLSSVELLSIVDDDLFFSIAARWFENLPADDLSANIQPDVDGSAPGPSVDAGLVATPNAPAQTTGSGVVARPQRPLNAFMAFRSKIPSPSGHTFIDHTVAYYLKLFPEAQQKVASGHLTNLWGLEPFRNKWALIAKVYSFARDEVGKSNISLGGFLAVCCPIMNIISPDVYLATLGWAFQEDSAGNQSLVRNIGVNFAPEENDTAPTTEIELLRALLRTGYLSQQGYKLMDRLYANTSGIMTTAAVPSEAPYLNTHQKMNFNCRILKNPVGAARDLISPDFNPGQGKELPVRHLQIDTMRRLPINYLAPPQPGQLVNNHFQDQHDLQSPHGGVLAAAHAPAPAASRVFDYFMGKFRSPRPPISCGIPY